MSPRKPAYDPSKPLEGASECPHCGAWGVVVPHGEHRCVCGICGAPRVKLTEAGYELSGAEQAPLSRAQGARRQRFFWRLAGGFGGLVGVMGLGMTALLTAIFSVGWLTGLGIATALPFLLLAAVAWRKSGKRTNEIAAAVDEAWAAAARDVVRASPHGASAEQIRKLLGLSEEVTGQVLARLEVDGRVSSRVSEQGKLIYSAQGGPQIRIDAGATGAGLTRVAVADQLEDRFAVLEEAMASEQQAAAERKDDDEKVRE